MRWRIWLVAAAVLILGAGGVEGKTFVVILGGKGGLPKYTARFAKQVNALQELLTTEYGYREEEVFALFESTDPQKNSTAENIRALFHSLARRISAEDDLIVILIGHGTYDGVFAKFNIPGPDLRDADFAALLDGVRAKSILFINTTAASGVFLPKISGPGRIVMTATRSGIERNETHFAEFLLQALNDRASADFNKDGRISALEAFVAARDRLVRFYEQERRLRPEHPLLDDTGDGEGTETPDLFTGDGRLANQFQFEQTEAATAVAAAPKLNRRQQEILAQVQKLQAKKAEMPEEEYYRQFEKLMLELAKLNQKSQKAGGNPLPRRKRDR